MGTGNALRATETFTLIQLEEERQKLKKKELLKSMLTDSEFSIKGQCAINLMMTKLEIINTFLQNLCFFPYVASISNFPYESIITSITQLV